MMLHKKKTRRFRTQLFVLICPILILPALFIGFLSYNVSFNALQSRTITDVNRIASLVNQNLDYNLKQIFQLAKTPLYDQEIQKIVTFYSNNPQTKYPEPKDVAIVNNFLLDLKSRSQVVSNVYIFTKSSVYFDISRYKLVTDIDWKGQKWFSDAVKAADQPILFPTQAFEPSIYLPATNRPSLFSVAQKIINVNTFETEGVILFDIDLAVIDQIINISQANNTARFFVVAANDGDLIYPSQSVSSSIQSNSLELIHQAIQQRKRQISFEGVSYFLSNNTSAVSGWVVIALIPESSLTQDIEAIKWTTGFIVGITVFFALSFFVFIANSISKPITQMRSLMKRVEKGDLHVLFQGKGNGEIVLLGNSFNSMLSKLRQLIQDNYTSKLKRHKAELSALQSQINPHFLYNTLESFQMIAITEGSERIARMSYALGQLMRHSLTKKELVHLEQELDHIENFLLLVKERYEERLAFNIQVPPEFYDCILPKFTLQPLVENAVYHGIDPKIGRGFVGVACYQDNQDLVIEISDDGVGMSAEVKQNLQHSLEYGIDVLERSQHIGMLNVQGQIRNIFGAVYGLVIHSSLSGGTKIVVRLPLRRI